MWTNGTLSGAALVALSLSCLAVADGGVRPHVVVVGLAGNNVQESDLALLSDRLRIELAATGGFRVIDPVLVDSLQAQQAQAGRPTTCLTVDCALEIGRLAGAHGVVVGNVVRSGATYTVSVRLLDVPTGRVKRFASQVCTCPFETVLGGMIRRTALDLATTDEDRADPLRALARSPEDQAARPGPRAKLHAPPEGLSVGISGLIPGGDLDRITDRGASLSVRYLPREVAGLFHDGAQLDVLFWTGPLHEIAVVGQYVAGISLRGRSHGSGLFVRAGGGIGHRHSLSGSSSDPEFSARDLAVIDPAYQFGGGVALGKLRIIVERQAIGSWAWVSLGVAYAL